MPISTMPPKSDPFPAIYLAWANAPWDDLDPDSHEARIMRLATEYYRRVHPDSHVDDAAAAVLAINFFQDHIELGPDKVYRFTEELAESNPVAKTIIPDTGYFADMDRIEELTQQLTKRI